MSGEIEGSMGSANDISAVGLHWQSLIVSPQLPAWAKLAAVPRDAKYNWWSRLRQVPADYVVSRNEAERFLYYDGPTHRPSPVEVVLSGGKLLWRKKAEEPVHRETAPEPVYTRQTKTFGRSGMFVQVRKGQARAEIIPEEAVIGPAGGFKISQELLGDAAGMLMNMLTEAGLTQEEARGLVDAWRPQFFEKGGDRLLVRFSSEDYDAMCPMQIQPSPTQLVRVGLLLTEFGDR
jgi:hypothetical protein